MSSWRLILALVISTLVTCLMFAEALVVRPNFYSACISLTQSNSKKSVLLATILTHIFCARKLLMRIFYGELRAVEEQHTGEKLWYSGTEILFAIAVFHKELSQVHYASIFTFVWLVKSLHWVAEDRVDLLFTTGESDWAHVRYLSTLTVLCATDVYLLNSFYPHIDFDFSKFSTGVEQGIWVILALEIGLVLNSIALCHNKYLISMRERYFLRQNPNDETWAHKKDWLFAAEAASDLIQIAMFCIFFVLISSSHGMPIFKFRDAVVSVLNLVSRVKGYYNYRVLTRQVDSFTTSPSEDDLVRNQTCIICFEDMELVEEPKQLVPKKLSCGHVLHNGCLKHWLERSKLCPTCRRNVFTAPEAAATTTTVAQVIIPVAPQVADHPAWVDQAVQQQQRSNTESSSSSSSNDAHSHHKLKLRQSAIEAGVHDSWEVFPTRRNDKNQVELCLGEGKWAVLETVY